MQTAITCGRFLPGGPTRVRERDDKSLPRYQRTSAVHLPGFGSGFDPAIIEGAAADFFASGKPRLAPGRQRTRFGLVPEARTALPERRAYGSDG